MSIHCLISYITLCLWGRQKQISSNTTEINLETATCFGRLTQYFKMR